jgi:ornithine cyclodeaminase/alanine dehydrogenase-like protein (mu-crystallin family)
LAAAVEAGLLGREHVVQIGDVLVGTADGRRSAAEITIFDSTGLALQDLAVALIALESSETLDAHQIPL